MDYDDDDFMSHSLSSFDPPDLWISTPDDQFPDPKLDVDSFMIYCGESFPRLTSYLWLVTREMIEKGEELKPLAIHEPFMFSKLVNIKVSYRIVFGGGRNFAHECTRNFYP